MPWTVAIDVGGTFTDGVARSDAGDELTVKVPSVPDDPARGLLAAIVELDEAGLPLHDVSLVFHGTTIATNAVINDSLARVVLLATDGFRDVLAYRWGRRSDAYSLRQAAPTEFVPDADRIGVAERLTGEGAVLTPLAATEIDRVVAAVRQSAPQAVAVALLFSYIDDRHERTLAAALKDALGDVPVSTSAVVAREFREYPRTVTTVVNAGLRPVVGRYLVEASRRIQDLGVVGGFLVMQSNGGGVPAERAVAEAHQMLLSGPAAAIAGVTALGALCGEPNLISLDMGGTSADVCLIRGGVAPVTAMQHIDTHPILAPSVDIHTAGAGGGSVVEVDAAGRLRVGPHSAGADPGPVAYGRGGNRPTLTDAHLVAGTLGDTTALGGRIILDTAAATKAISAVAADLSLDIERTAEGIVALATANLEGAIRNVSIERGEDPREYTLVAFGGAGPLHAGQLIRDLAMPAAVIPRYPGLFSAAGLLAADLRMDDAITVLQILDEAAVAGIGEWMAAAAGTLTLQLQADGIDPNRIRAVGSIDCRYVGQGYELNVPVGDVALPDLAAIVERFHGLHHGIYGHSSDDAIEAVTLRVSAFGGRPQASVATTIPPGDDARPEPIGQRDMMVRGEQQRVPTPVYRRTSLGAGSVLAGPAIVEQLDSTIVILPGQAARTDEYGNMWLKELEDD